MTNNLKAIATGALIFLLLATNLLTAFMLFCSERELSSYKINDNGIVFKWEEPTSTIPKDGSLVRILHTEAKTVYLVNPDYKSPLNYISYERHR